MQVSSPPSGGDLEEQLIRSLAVIGRAAKHSLNAGMERGAQWLLLVLDSRGAMRLNQLASACELDGSTVSRHVRQLEEHELVSRRPDPEDGRAQLVQLTEAGSAVVHEIQSQRRALIADRLAHWTRDDLRTLTTLMARLADEIQATQNDPRKNQ